jgi:quinol monooxygenase YgiN
MSRTHLIVRHAVDDYAAWRSAYDSAEDLRQRFGCTRAAVLTDPGDKNDVYVVHEFPSLDQAQDYAASDDLRAAMRKAGVSGPPRIEIAVEA